MSSAMMIDTALRLSAPEVEALILGRSLVAMPLQFLEVGEYALCPDRPLIPTSSPSHYYKPDFLDLANTPAKPQVKAWAKCDRCELIDETEDLEKLSDLTLWTPETLREIIAERELIFLAYFRVYLLPEPLEVEAINPEDEFIPLLSPISITTANPVFDDDSFRDRCERLLKRQLPEHPELEALQTAIAQYALINPEAKRFANDIKRFLGINVSLKPETDPNLAWIDTIVDLGNRSKEKDEGKSNYQAGTDFENVVRQSLEFLGFTIDLSHRGGAGGLDLFCSHPYPIFGECKSGKKIPNDTAVQLLNLMTLRSENIDIARAGKIIIGPGKLTNQLEEAAKKHGMSIINPETLQKLVKLQSQYPNSVDLFELKDFLVPGQSDESIDRYIEQVKQKIQLRTQIIKALQKLEELGNNRPKKEVVRTQYNAMFASDIDSAISVKFAEEILIELSSPLTGYLGRIKEEGSDEYQFYFIREMPEIDSQSS